MNEEQYDELKSINNRLVNIDELSDKSERTLLYGYDIERNTWHIYLKNDEIHIFVYDRHYNRDYSNYTVEEMRHYSNDIIDTLNTHLIPDKRLYPEACDFEFCKLLRMKDFNLPFTGFDIKRESKQFHGEIK